MAAWTLAEARARLTTWLEAEAACAVAGQSYTIGSRSLTRSDLVEIGKRIDFWRQQVAQLEGGTSGLRVQRIVPRDL